MSTPVGGSVAKPHTDSCAPVTAAGTLRTARSRSASAATATTASSDAGVKPSRPGWRTSRTPEKPTAMALQRRHPTGSSRNTAAPNVTASGNACRMAEALERVVSTMADTNAAVATISPRLRSMTGSDSTAREHTRWPRRRAKVVKVSVPPRPIRTMIWPMGSPAAICLISMSSSAKLAMASTIIRLPRRLSIGALSRRVGLGRIEGAWGLLHPRSASGAPAFSLSTTTEVTS